MSAYLLTATRYMLMKKVYNMYDTVCKIRFMAYHLFKAYFCNK